VEIEKSQLEFTPAPGDYLQDLARKVAATPATIVRQTTAALRPK
jgi:hypothetical protein